MVDKFVVDGFERACASIEQQVRTDVIAEYADRLAAASFWQRVSLKRKLKRDIERRVAERIKATGISPDSLY
jgi:hypothetical protein